MNLINFYDSLRKLKPLFYPNFTIAPASHSKSKVSGAIGENVRFLEVNSRHGKKDCFNSAEKLVLEFKSAVTSHHNPRLAVPKDSFYIVLSNGIVIISKIFNRSKSLASEVKLKPFPGFK